MINDRLIAAFLRTKDEADLAAGIIIVIEHFKIQDSYNAEEYVNNLVEVIDEGVVITTKDISLEVIKTNKSLIYHDPDKIVVGSIHIDAVDNITKQVKVTYKAEDMSYPTYTFISYAEHPEIIVKRE